MTAPTRAEIAEHWTGPDYQSSWTCTCGYENPERETFCTFCRDERPTDEA